MSGLYGYNTSLEKSDIAIQQTPWEVTTSYGSGTSKGPQAILQASPQLDLFSYDNAQLFANNKPHLLDVETEITKLNDVNKVRAQKIIQHLETNKTLTDDLQKELELVNSDCEKMLDIVYKKTKSLIKKNKLLGLIGGDHSSPLGFIKAISETHSNYDILHIDAHLDLRQAYQGFKHSHASIMYNALNLPNPPQNLISVGIRDFCYEEMNLVNSDKRLQSFTDYDIAKHLAAGKSWTEIGQQICSQLNNPTYISFDIDGLDPKYCPNTGTPVPGGLSFNQSRLLIDKVCEKNKIIGFDLCEVSPSNDRADEWDGNVGARILFCLCAALKSTSF